MYAHTLNVLPFTGTAVVIPVLTHLEIQEVLFSYVPVLHLVEIPIIKTNMQYITAYMHVLYCNIHRMYMIPTVICILITSTCMSLNCT